MESYRLTLAVLSLTAFFTTVLGQDELERFREDALAAHNMYRAKHGSPPLKRSAQLDNVAQKYAIHLADIGQMQHSSGSYGENLAWKSGGDLTGQEVTAMWYNEVSQYSYDAASFSSGTGHFTQVVWKSTQYVGFGKESTNGQVYVVANYDPAGNMGGQYKSNVLRPGQQETPEIPVDRPPTPSRRVTQPPSQPEEPYREVPTQRRQRQRDPQMVNRWNGNRFRWF